MAPEPPTLNPNARYSICAGCPHARDRPLLGIVCELCGCVMRLKVRASGARCPDGRW